MANIPADFREPLNQTKMGAAILAACVVRTLNESDPTFQKRFLDHLAEAYGEVRDDCAEVDCLELLTWLRQMLQTGDLRWGQGQ